jgi:hypothetical protein
VTDLCAIIKKSKTRLNLNVDGVSLSRQAETDLQMKNFEDCEPVSFTKGFLENETELGFEGKVCLAVILSYAFLDFCGKPWFPGGWTKDSLYLMQHGGNLFLQPFLVTNMAATQRESKPPAPATAARAMKLLHHGILLMEIFQQDPLRVTPKPGGKVASLEDTAQESFKSIEWDLCERFGQVVGTCIKGKFIDSAIISSIPSLQSAADPSASHSSSPPEISDEDFGRLFCERILAPLEADFASQWQGKDPDQVISTLKLPSIKQEPNPSLKPKPTTSKVCLTQRQLRIVPHPYSLVPRIALDQRRELPRRSPLDEPISLLSH